MRGERPRVLFAHVEKTGGSALECASVPFVDRGLWVNLGHTTLTDLDYCIAACQPAVVAISVRDPYTWYGSLLSEIVRNGWFAGIQGSLKTKPEWASFRARVLSNLTTFVRFIANAELFPRGWKSPFRFHAGAPELDAHTGAQYSLSAVLRRTCGEDCSRRFVVLHQERLTCEVELFSRAFGLPMQRLGKMRSAPLHNSTAPRPQERRLMESLEKASPRDAILEQSPTPEVATDSTASPAVTGTISPARLRMTREACELISRMDGLVLKEFGYRSRNCSKLPGPG
jgi:hypothetical protein